MYVLMDIEWVQNADCKRHPTQIAAMRVDACWHFENLFYTRIQPLDESFCMWEHMAYAGGTADDFLSAPVMAEVAALLKSWLREDDILCWWTTDPMEFFGSVFDQISQNRLVLFPYLRVFLANRPYLTGSPYHIADQLRIERYGCKHDSRSDVEMMRRALWEIGLPQRLLTEPVPRITGGEKILIPYVLDVSANRFHKRECDKIPLSCVRKEYPSLWGVINKGGKPCSCCTKDFSAVRRERNRWIIENSQYNFIFAPSSDVFHTRDCKLVLSSGSDVRGTMKYKTCIERGRKPCKLCKPSPLETKAPPLKKSEKQAVASDPTNVRKRNKRSGKRNLTAEEQRALVRLRQAQTERDKIKNMEGNNPQEKEDLRTLSQPAFAFWAAAGYGSFHLRHCGKLNALSNFKGFGLYEDAVRAGYRPCRQCKPTAKHNMVLSFPFFSKERPEETLDVLCAACKTTGYVYTELCDCCQIETPIGIWKIHTDSVPYRLEHINKRYTPGNRTEFHVQPRIFLSLTDAFIYIKRHDSDE